MKQGPCNTIVNLKGTLMANSKSVQLVLDHVRDIVNRGQDFEELKAFFEASMQYSYAIALLKTLADFMAVNSPEVDTLREHVEFCSVRCSRSPNDFSARVPSRADMAPTIELKEEIQYQEILRNLIQSLKTLCTDGNGEEIFRCRGYIDARVISRLAFVFAVGLWKIRAEYDRNGFDGEGTIFFVDRIAL
jgi:hypothetical protein